MFFYNFPQSYTILVMTIFNTFQLIYCSTVQYLFVERRGLDFMKTNDFTQEKFSCLVDMLEFVNLTFNNF